MIDSAFATDMSSGSHKHVFGRCDVRYRRFVWIVMWDPELHREAICHVPKRYLQSAHKVDEKRGQAILESFFISGLWTFKA